MTDELSRDIKYLESTTCVPLCGICHLHSIDTGTSDHQCNVSSVPYPTGTGILLMKVSGKFWITVLGGIWTHEWGPPAQQASLNHQTMELCNSMTRLTPVFPGCQGEGSTVEGTRQLLIHVKAIKSNIFVNVNLHLHNIFPHFCKS